MEKGKSSTRSFGNYEIQGELGRGGMGVVYKAHERILQREVALKILPRSLAGDANLVKRFLREARAVARLSHRNIVRVYAVGEQKGTYFIAMEFVRGESLAQRLKEKGQLPLDHALRITQEIAEALAEAHRHGIVHRDIKPANIMLDHAGRTKVLDFGLAQVTTASTRLTIGGGSVGTPAFMSPEQCRGGRLDHRSDIYSLGAAFYMMLTGRRPYSGSDPMSTMYQITHEPFPILSELLPDLPPGVTQLLDKMVAKDPDHRYASAEALAKDLDKIRQEPKLEVQGFVPPKLDDDLRKDIVGGIEAEQAIDQQSSVGASDVEQATEQPSSPRRIPLRWAVPCAILLIASAGFVVAFLRAPGGASSSWTIPTPELSVGTKSTYVNVDGATIDFEITDRFEQDGETYFRQSYTIENPAGDPLGPMVRHYWVRKPDGIYLYREPGDKYPIRMTKYPLSPGMAWNADVYMNEIGRSVDLPTRVHYRTEADEQFPPEAQVIVVRTSIETGSELKLEDTLNSSISPDFGLVAFTADRNYLTLTRLEEKGQDVDLSALWAGGLTR